MITPEKAIKIQDAVLAGEKMKLTGEERELAERTEKIISRYMDGLKNMIAKRYDKQ